MLFHLDSTLQEELF